MDRVDIQCEIHPVPFSHLSQAQPGEGSLTIREKVIKARKIQEERYKDFKGIHCNAQMTENIIAITANKTPTNTGIMYF